MFRFRSKNSPQSHPSWPRNSSSIMSFFSLPNPKLSLVMNSPFEKEENYNLDQTLDVPRLIPHFPSVQPLHQKRANTFLVISLYPFAHRRASTSARPRGSFLANNSISGGEGVFEWNNGVCPRRDRPPPLLFTLLSLLNGSSLAILTAILSVCVVACDIRHGILI